MKGANAQVLRFHDDLYRSGYNRNGADDMRSEQTSRMLRIRIAATACLCMLVAGTALGREVTVDFDKDTDFSRFQTYSFAMGTPSPVSLVNQRIERAIAAELDSKGLKRVESGGDLTVVFHCALSKRTQLNSSNLGGWGWGPGWRRWGGFGGTVITQVEEIPVGTLIVDIGDSAAKRYVWRGSATKTLSSKPEKNQKNIESEVRKMFEKFPPEEKR